ncbi:hypothetical protein [Paenibacillus lignilyticus]|uniref:DUF4352 domain-containing protein n=1 Tax=Paenibacillus lignilyticus TaxID=1172615 RepID=A0ABS5C9Y4_9BACL|nr:hypothetical protein [Paenibacillus lignilyticus]MBP3962813.1 hypothetical protein [Paenibacillus lignilyticus]
MKRLLKISRIVPIIGALIILVIVAGTIWYQRAEPLMNTGFTVFTDAVSKDKYYTIEVVNKSQTNIDIQSVTVNGKQVPDSAQLGITYDSNHLVQFAGDQTDPATKVMDLHDASIAPQLFGEEVHAVLTGKESSGHRTPIHYGIIIKFSEEAIQEVTIRYRYLGFTKVCVFPLLVE